MAEQTITQRQAYAIQFIGDSLSPFFTHDPKLDKKEISPLFDAFVSLNPKQASSEWPFVENSAAYSAIVQMQEGLQAGIDDEQLYWEYRRLFVGPQKKAAAPWGSVYLDKDQVIFGSSTMRLHDWMRHNGIAVQKHGSDEPEDHIGTMLAMMAYLAVYKPNLVHEFLQLHLLTWAGHFLDLMYKASTHSFYKGLALLTQESLRGIQNELQIEVTCPRFYR